MNSHNRTSISTVAYTQPGAPVPEFDYELIEAHSEVGRPSRRSRSFNCLLAFLPDPTLKRSASDPNGMASILRPPPSPFIHPTYDEPEMNSLSEPAGFCRSALLLQAGAMDLLLEVCLNQLSKRFFKANKWVILGCGPGEFKRLNSWETTNCWVGTVVLLRQLFVL